jgi:hypothetical protein
VKRWLEALATALGFHKPEGRTRYGSWTSSRLRASSPRLEQGGSLTSSSRESARANGSDPLNRRPAVVGLAAPPYGLPSTDPTTRPSAFGRLRRPPVPSSRCSSADALGSQVPAALNRLAAKCGWSAHADNRTRGGNSPLSPLPLRGPQRFGADHLLLPTALLSPECLSAPWRVLP